VVGFVALRKSSETTLTARASFATYIPLAVLFLLDVRVTLNPRVFVNARRLLKNLGANVSVGVTSAFYYIWASIRSNVAV